MHAVQGMLRNECCFNVVTFFFSYAEYERSQHFNELESSEHFVCLKNFLKEVKS